MYFNKIWQLFRFEKVTFVKLYVVQYLFLKLIYFLAFTERQLKILHFILKKYSCIIFGSHVIIGLTGKLPYPAPTSSAT